ncbi:MAG: M56 family metallopeptidase [Pseudomonadota bacterium]
MVEHAVYIFALNTLALSIAAAGFASLSIFVFRIERADTRCSIWTTAFFAAAMAPLLTVRPEVNLVKGKPLMAPVTSALTQPPASSYYAEAPLTQTSTGSPIAETLAIALLLLWALGFAWHLFTLCRDTGRISHLRNESEPVPAKLCNDVENSKTGLRIHSDVSVPFATGLFNPIIIMPKSMVIAPDRKLVANALRHEIAHIQRGDLVSAFLESLMLSFYWWNPLLWRMRARICEHREMACDDTAIAHSKSPTDYAESLLTIVEARLRTDNFRKNGAALSAVGESSLIHKRITRLLSDGYHINQHTPWALRRLAPGALAFFLIGGALAAPSAPIPVNVSYYGANDPQPEPQSASEALGRELVRAIADEDFAAAYELINRGADLNAVVYHDGTPLIAAVNIGSQDIVERLIAAGADIEAEALYDETALISAVRRNDEQIVRMLLAAGADPNHAAQTNTGERRSPLGEALKNENGAIADILRDAGARR